MKIDVAQLGKDVREKRSLDAVNQGVVARKVGVAQGVISRIENGYGGIDGDLYVRLCTWLGVSLETFVVRDRQPQAA